MSGSCVLHGLVQTWIWIDSFAWTFLSFVSAEAIWNWNTTIEIDISDAIYSNPDTLTVESSHYAAHYVRNIYLFLLKQTSSPQSLFPWSSPTRHPPRKYLIKLQTQMIILVPPWKVCTFVVRCALCIQNYNATRSLRLFIVLSLWPPELKMKLKLHLLPTNVKHQISTHSTNTGISKLCEHLDIDPVEDVKILVLLHKMGSNSKPAQISREEWMSGCQKLGLGDINSFKALLPSLELGFMERADFRDFFKVCFSFWYLSLIWFGNNYFSFFWLIPYSTSHSLVQYTVLLQI